MRVNLLLFLLLLIFIDVNGKEKNYGEYSIYFLKFAKGVRSLGLGGGGISLCDSADIIYNNPAGIADIKNIIIGGDYTSWFTGLGITTYQFLVSKGVGKQTVFGATCSYLKSTIEEAKETGFRTGKQVGVSSLILGITLAKKYNKDWYAGGTLNLIRENLALETGETVAFNLGVLHRYTPNLTFGCSVLHFGPNIRFGTKKYPLPATFGIGFSTKPKILEEKVLFVGDLERDKTGLCLKLGVEYLILPMLSVRAGYNTTSGTAFGISVYSKGEGSYSHLSAILHYAYLLQNRTALDYPSHHLSLVFLF